MPSVAVKRKRVRILFYLCNRCHIKELHINISGICSGFSGFAEAVRWHGCLESGMCVANARARGCFPCPPQVAPIKMSSWKSRFVWKPVAARKSLWLRSRRREHAEKRPYFAGIFGVTAGQNGWSHYQKVHILIMVPLRPKLGHEGVKTGPKGARFVDLAIFA